MRLRGRVQSRKMNLDMTAMIDVVFQLLAFFVMTFQIVAPEGDFNVHMPARESGDPTPVALAPPLRVRLHADDSGQLARIELADRPLEGMDALRTRVQQLVGQGVDFESQSDLEVELECDYHLHYVHVIDAVTAVTGYREDGRTVKLIEKIKFIPQPPQG